MGMGCTGALSEKRTGSISVLTKSGIVAIRGDGMTYISLIISCIAIGISIAVLIMNRTR